MLKIVDDIKKYFSGDGKYNKHKIYRNQIAGGTPVSVRWAPPIGSGSFLDVYKVPAGHYLLLLHASIFSAAGAAIAFLEFLPPGFANFPVIAGTNYIPGAVIFLGAPNATQAQFSATFLSRNVIIPELSVVRLGTGQSSIALNAYFIVMFGLLYKNEESPLIDPSAFLVEDYEV